MLKNSEFFEENAIQIKTKRKTLIHEIKSVNFFEIVLKVRENGIQASRNAAV